jgi:LuxR family transcriptional regulator, maltose regulon positive regulatory protein
MVQYLPRSALSRGERSPGGGDRRRLFRVRPGRSDRDWLDCENLAQGALQLLRDDDVPGAREVIANMLLLAQGRRRGWGNVWAARTLQRARVHGMEQTRAASRPLASVSTIVPGRGPAEIKQQSRPIQIRALGSFDLTIDGIPFTGGVKPQRRPLDLLKALVAVNGHAASTSELADKLWPDSDGDTARNSLQVAVHRLRRLLGRDQAVVVQDRKIYLDHALCWVDLWAFAEEAGSATRAGSAHPHFAQRAAGALELYRGHLVTEEPGHAWMLAVRERMRHAWLCLVKLLGDYYEERGDCQRAGDLYQQALEIDPLAEEVYRRLMGCQQRTGQRAEAIHTYCRCREQLVAALGVPPSEETERLYHTLRLVA